MAPKSEKKRLLDKKWIALFGKDHKFKGLVARGRNSRDDSSTQELTLKPKINGVIIEQVAPELWKIMQEIVQTYPTWFASAVKLQVKDVTVTVPPSKKPIPFKEVIRYRPGDNLMCDACTWTTKKPGMMQTHLQTCDYYSNNQDAVNELMPTIQIQSNESDTVEDAEPKQYGFIDSDEEEEYVAQDDAVIPEKTLQESIFAPFQVDDDLPFKFELTYSIKKELLTIKESRDTVRVISDALKGLEKSVLRKYNNYYDTRVKVLKAKIRAIKPDDDGLDEEISDSSVSSSSTMILPSQILNNFDVSYFSKAQIDELFDKIGDEPILARSKQMEKAKDDSSVSQFLETFDPLSFTEEQIDELLNKIGDLRVLARFGKIKQSGDNKYETWVMNEANAILQDPKDKRIELQILGRADKILKKYKLPRFDYKSVASHLMADDSNGNVKSSSDQNQLKQPGSSKTPNVRDRSKSSYGRRDSKQPASLITPGPNQSKSNIKNDPNKSKSTTKNDAKSRTKTNRLSEPKTDTKGGSEEDNSWMKPQNLDQRFTNASESLDISSKRDDESESNGGSIESDNESESSESDAQDDESTGENDDDDDRGNDDDESTGENDDADDRGNDDDDGTDKKDDDDYSGNDDDDSGNENGDDGQINDDRHKTIYKESIFPNGKSTILQGIHPISEKPSNTTVTEETEADKPTGKSDQNKRKRSDEKDSKKDKKERKKRKKSKKSKKRRRDP